MDGREQCGCRDGGGRPWQKGILRVLKEEEPKRKVGPPPQLTSTECRGKDGLPFLWLAALFPPLPPRFSGCDKARCPERAAHVGRS